MHLIPVDGTMLARLFLEVIGVIILVLSGFLLLYLNDLLFILTVRRFVTAS